MNPDAQNITDKDLPLMSFKLIPGSGEEMEAEEKKSGELIAWLKDDGTWEEKPYPNEHACRLEDPGKYIRIRRQNDKFGKGIHAIWGVQKGDKPVELQAIRFDKTKFTVAEARSWIKDHDYKCKMFEPASEKCDKCGKWMLVKWDQDVLGENCVKTCDASLATFHYEHDGECVKEEPLPEPDDKGKFCSCDGEADDKGICKECHKPKEPKKEMVVVVDDQENMKINLEKILDEFSKKVREAIDPLKIMIDEMKVEAEKLKARIDALSVKSGTEKETEGGIPDNPPEPRKVVVINTENQKRAVLAEATKQISQQLTEMMGRLKEEIRLKIKEEIDKARGRVN